MNIARLGVAPDEGESANDLQGRFPSLAMGPLVRPAQLADGSVEVSIDPARFHDVFCADVPDADAAFMAISQRPVSATAFDDPATAAAWRTKPSWAVFGTADYPVAPELHRFSYDRAAFTVTGSEGASHFLMLSQPNIVRRRHSRGRHRKRSQPSGVKNVGGSRTPVQGSGVGTAVALSWLWLTAVALAGVYFVYSATVEEHYLTGQFPDTYPAYKRSTKMLVPFIF